MLFDIFTAEKQLTSGWSYAKKQYEAVDGATDEVGN